MWFDTILWLVAIVAFIMVEAATTALVSVWFAVGAAAAMLVSFFDVGFGWQMLVFAVISAITLGLMLPRLISRRGAHRAPVTNGSPLTIGKQGVVLVDIEPGLPGRVRVDGLDWQARAPGILVDAEPLGDIGVGLRHNNDAAHQNYQNNDEQDGKD